MPPRPIAMASPVLLLAALCALFSAAAGVARGGEAEVGAAAFHSRATDPNMEVKFDFSPFIQYKSGHHEPWLMDTTFVPPSPDGRTGVASKDVVLDQAIGLRARVYLPSHRAVGGGGGGRIPVLVYFHGGGFMWGSAFDPLYHGYVNALTAKANVVAVSVNYRLAPQHPLPAAYDDAWTALAWVLRNARHGGEPWLAMHGDASRLFLAGDSAGGNIAHTLAMRAGQHGDGTMRAAIRGVALLDPYVDPTGIPVSAWRAFPPARVLMTVSEKDSLGPLQRKYMDALRVNGWGGRAQLYFTPGEGHCYFLSNIASPKASAHMATVAAFIIGS